MQFDLDAALDEAIQRGASDLHLKVPSPPKLRVSGELAALDGFPALKPSDTEEIASHVLRTEAKHKHFDEHGAVEVSYYTKQGRFRASVFRQRGSVAIVFRLIPEAPEPEGLGIPDVVLSWAGTKRGLVIVGGPTGAGKSTTSAVLLRLINQSRNCHVVTIEDPIEFLHPDLQASLSQREIGVDAPTFHDALRSALRQDPDVILIGEVRDEETAMTALRAAETGHFVICTIHTSGAAEAVQRFVELFGPRNERVARELLAQSLVGVISQRLVPAAGGGLVLNPDVMVATSRVVEILRDGGSAGQLQEAMLEGEYYGMRTFDQDLASKVHDGVVEEQTALSYASNRQDFKLMLQGSLVARAGAANIEAFAEQEEEVPPSV